MKNNDFPILAVVVLYNPDIQLLKKNLFAFQQYVNKIILWDNSSYASTQQQIDKLLTTFSNIIVIHKKINMGISTALNYAWNFANNHGYKAMLTMDQDSIFHYFPIFKNKVIEFWEREGLCICGPAICDASKTTFETYDSFIEKKHIITSGMLVPIELLNKIGGYCEDFFVDGVDVELCVKARQYNYKSFIYRGAFLAQIYGTPQSRKILGKTLRSFGYAPNRLYNIFKSQIIIFRKYHYPLDILKDILYNYMFRFTLKGVMLVEHNKREKLKAVCQGIKDGLLAKI